MPRTSTQSLEDALAKIESSFALDADALKKLTGHFVDAMDNGLKGRPSGEMAMIPSYGGFSMRVAPDIAVVGLPDGSETGSYLSLDLGGTKL